MIDIKSLLNEGLSESEIKEKFQTELDARIAEKREAEARSERVDDCRLDMCYALIDYLEAVGAIDIDLGSDEAVDKKAEEFVKSFKEWEVLRTRGINRFKMWF